MSLKSFGCFLVELNPFLCRRFHRCGWRHSVFQHFCAVQPLYLDSATASALFTGQRVYSWPPRETNFPHNRFVTANLTICDSATERILLRSGPGSAAAVTKELAMLFLLAWFFWGDIAFCCGAVRDIAVGRAAGWPRRWRRTLSTPLSVQRQVSDLRKGNIPSMIQLCLHVHWMSRTMTCLYTQIPMLMMLQWCDEEQWRAHSNRFLLRSLKLLSDLADKNLWSYDLWRVYIVTGLAALRDRFFIYYVYLF